MLSFRTKRSGGIRVTAAVHRLVARGNAARDRRDWEAAAEAYGQALKGDERLVHIWVQFGHALKEQGRVAEAGVAYRRAPAIRPGDPDPSLHLGHLAHMAGDPVAAGHHYLAACQADPGHADAAMGLHRAIGQASGATRGRLLEAIHAALGEAEDGAALPERAGGELGDELAGRTSLVFDVSDLVGYFTNSRLPTGIQRVQIQTIGTALRGMGRQGGRDVRLCCFIDGRDAWLEIGAAAFLALIDLSLQSGDRTERVWISALHRLHLRLSVARPFVFPTGAWLVNLGSSWQLQNYFLFVREAKRRHGIRYVPFIHDLIPVVRPEHFIRSARLETVPWFVGVFNHADHFLVNSESTRRDLLQTGWTLGHDVGPGRVSVVRLDADARDPAAAVLPDEALARWQLRAGGFVLLVSTVESRKGHAVAFEAWAGLLARHGAERVPKLVCVGKKGWLSDAVYARLDTDPALAAHVLMLSGIADDALALLYRTCLFTVYPSLYEGWGLPITESLCHGKPVIASDCSSLPEAGGEFAVYVAPGCAVALAEAVERMTFDGGYRAGITARIAAGFRPRSWSDVARQIEGVLNGLTGAHTPPARPAPVPMAVMGAYHSLARSTADRVYPGLGVGEAFRAGVGWGVPDWDASWTRAGGGELVIGVGSEAGGLRMGLLLVGPSDRELAWQVTIREGPVVSGRLGRSRRKCVSVHLPEMVRSEGAALHVRLRGQETGNGLLADTDSPIGIAGFFLFGDTDDDARMRVLEAIAFGNLEEMDAFRDVSDKVEAVGDWAVGWMDAEYVPAT